MRKMYFPIGTVVSLKGIEKRVMIYGISQKVNKNGEEQVYDYVACMYPEGNVNDEKIVFNQEDINVVFFIGFQDPEQLLFRAALDEEIGATILSQLKESGYDTNV